MVTLKVPYPKVAHVGNATHDGSIAASVTGSSPPGQ